MTTDTIVRVDPGTLFIGANVRRDAELSEYFTQSIRESGVRIPIVAYEGAEGLVVVDGQRRTLAALEVGLTEVPVAIVEMPEESVRLLDQVLANEQRLELTEKDAAKAISDLALFDLEVPVIAARLGFDPQFVEKAITVGRSKAASKVLDTTRADLDDAFLLAEFDDDPEGQEQLIALAEAGSYWAGRAQQMRDAKEIAEVEAQIQEQGLTLIKDPSHGGDPAAVTHLYLDKGQTKPLRDLPIEDLKAKVGDGLRAYASLKYTGGRRHGAMAYAVAGWEARGFFGYRSGAQQKAETPEQIEAAKVARREARETTKAWVAEGALRIAFLQQLVQRKTMPKGWELVTARRMLDSQGSFSTTQLKSIHAILQLADNPATHSLRSTIQAHLETHPTSAPQIMLAVDLGCMEGGGEFEKKGWDGKAYGVETDRTAKYLQLLESWGHTLGDVEKAAVAAAAKKKPAAKK